MDGCPEVTQEVRVLALKQLACNNSKDDTEILRRGQDDHAKVAEEETEKSGSKKHKGKNGKLTAFLERPLDTKVSEDIDQ